MELIWLGGGRRFRTRLLSDRMVQIIALFSVEAISWAIGPINDDFKCQKLYRLKLEAWYR